MTNSVKRTAFVFLAILTLFAAPYTARGQVSVTVGGVQTEALGGQWGGDVRLWVEPPLSPLGGYLGADYFLADCTDDCGLWGWRVGGILRSGLPLVNPYITGAFVSRRVELDGNRFGKEGFAVGIGARLTTPLNIYAEASREFLGKNLKGWYVRIGLGI